MKKIKTIAAFFLAITSVLCCAEESSHQKCSYAKEDMKLVTPKDNNIVNSYWVNDVDGYETVDRLFVNYKNGSTAVIEHKYCSMYNFEVAYYSRDSSEFSNPASLEKTASALFELAAFSDNKTRNALQLLIKKLREKKFSYLEASSATYESSTEDSKRLESTLSYLPIEDSSLHKSALFIYMGIGGEH